MCFAENPLAVPRNLKRATFSEELQAKGSKFATTSEELQPKGSKLPSGQL